MLLALVLLAAAVLDGVRVSTSMDTFVAAYRRLHLGMSGAEVEALFGLRPRYTCTVGTLFVRYYVPHRIIVDRVFQSLGGKRPPRVATVAELPYLYGAVQVAFDDDRLVAYTWSGETTEIVALAGSRHGDNLSVLGTALQLRSPGDGPREPDSLN